MPITDGSSFGTAEVTGPRGALPPVGKLAGVAALFGALADPTRIRIIAALDLAERMRVPVEWYALSAGARISMDSGTENMDWVAAGLKRIIEFTQAGGEINVVVAGVNVGAQPYWNAEATMLMHTRGILVMTPDSGPMHIANAMGTKVLGLHAASNPERSGPYSDRRYCVDRYDAAARRYLGQQLKDRPSVRGEAAGFAANGLLERGRAGRVDIDDATGHSSQSGLVRRHTVAPSSIKAELKSPTRLFGRISSARRQSSCCVAQSRGSVSICPPPANASAAPGPSS